MNPPFRYILRYKIDPDFHADDRLEELVHLCRDGRIEEVMLFITAEELSTGHLRSAEVEHYGEFARRVKERLARENVALSLNPWTTTYHVSRGRRLREGQDFRLLVGETGAVSPIVACPLCPRWQDYLCETFVRLAKLVEPTAIWVEDDWRLHNHEDDQGWGGCFCDEHMRKFSERAGCSVSREELLEKILAPGSPHPWRRLWLDLSRESLLAPARRLRAAFDKAAPEVRLGLMTSNPDVHSAEGRDWAALQEGFGNEPAFLVRPHMEPYTETPAISTPPAVTRLTLANLTGPLKVYPELENSPRGGLYSKSANYSLWECFNAALYGSQGITINHFDMMGNGTALDPTFGPAFGRAKDRLNALAELGIDDRAAEGVQVLFHPEVAAARHSTDPSSMNGLREDSLIWARTFSILGIAHGFRKEPRRGDIHAVNGQTLRAFSDADIEEILSGPVLLDALSVEVLLDRGFGSLIGVESADWRSLQDSAFAYEEIAEDRPEIYGHSRPRMTAQRCATHLLEMQRSADATILSQIRGPDHTVLFPGAVQFENKYGGRIVSLTYPLDGSAQFFMGFFNVFRRTFFQNLIFDLAQESPLAAAEGHPMHVYRAPSPDGLVIGAFNVISDPVGETVIRLPHRDADGDWERLLPNGRWETAPTKRQKMSLTTRLTIPGSLAPLEGIFLRRRT